MKPPTGNVLDKDAVTNPVERRAVAGFYRSLADLLPERAHRVLEVGCGEGAHLRRIADVLPEAELVGLDLHDDALQAHWRGLPAFTTCASAHDLPFPRDTFDLVLALEVLEHVDDPRQAVWEIARVARGPVILSVPWEPVWRVGNLVRGRYVSALGNTPGHVQHFGRRSFRRLVSRHLAVEEVRRPLPWTMVRARPRRTTR